MREGSSRGFVFQATGMPRSDAVTLLPAREFRLLSWREK